MFLGDDYYLFAYLSNLVSSKEIFLTERVVLLPKKGINIFKRKDGRWEARYLKGVDANGRKKYGSVYGKTFEEAKKKWDRRKDRINWNNLIIKYNDQNLFVEEDFYEFEKLPFENKIFFTANKNLKNKANCYYFSCFEKQGYVLDDIKTSEKYFNLKRYLNRIKT